MFIALAGTDTQYLIDMLEEMFGEGPLVDPEELLTGDVKAKFDATHAEEAAIAQTVRDPDPTTKTILYPKSLPIAPDFGLDFGLNLLPENIICTEKSATSGKMVDKFYYQCCVCKDHSSQNRPSMCTHTCKCLNVKLGCSLCPVTYDATDSLQNHIVKIHGGTLDRAKYTSYSILEVLAKLATTASASH